MLDHYEKKDPYNDKNDNQEKRQGSEFFHDKLKKALVIIRGELKNHLQRINGKAKKTRIIVVTVYFFASQFIPPASSLIIQIYYYFQQ